MVLSPSETSISFDVVAATGTILTITTDKTQYAVGETVNVTCRLSDLSDVPLGGAVVEFLVDGVSTNKRFTDSLGWVRFLHQFATTGTKTLKTAFNGDATYSASQASATISVIEAVVATTLRMKLDKLQYAPQETITVSLNLTRAGGTGIANQPIFVFLNSVTQVGPEVTTDANGNATKTLIAPSLGRHTLSALFQGATGFAMSDASSGITVTSTVVPTVDPRLGIAVISGLGAVGLIWLSKRKK